MGPTSPSFLFLLPEWFPHNDLISEEKAQNDEMFGVFGWKFYFGVSISNLAGDLMKPIFQKNGSKMLKSHTQKASKSPSRWWSGICSLQCRVATSWLVYLLDCYKQPWIVLVWRGQFYIYTSFNSYILRYLRLFDFVSARKLLLYLATATYHIAVWSVYCYKKFVFGR